MPPLALFRFWCLEAGAFQTLRYIVYEVQAFNRALYVSRFG